MIELDHRSIEEEEEEEHGEKEEDEEEEEDKKVPLSPRDSQHL